MRSSTGALDYPAYDPYAPGIARDYGPSNRSSADRFSIEELPPSRIYKGDRPSSGHYPEEYRRPRRATLDPEGPGRQRPVITTGLRPVIHTGAVKQPSGSSARPPRAEPEGDYYITPASSGRRLPPRGELARDPYEPLLRQPEQADRLHPRPLEPSQYRRPGRGGDDPRYHYNGPLVRQADPGDSRYGYEGYGNYTHGPAKEHPYYEPAPRRPRADSLDAPRRERPLSMVELGEHLPRGPGPRDLGPPPSMRGFDRLARIPAGAQIEPRTSVEGQYYDRPRDEKEAELSRGGSKSSRRRPVSLHQGDADPYSRSRPLAADERGGERSHRHRSHGIETEERALRSPRDEFDEFDPGADVSRHGHDPDRKRHHHHHRHSRHPDPDEDRGDPVVHGGERHGRHRHEKDPRERDARDAERDNRHGGQRVHDNSSPEFQEQSRSEDATAKQDKRAEQGAPSSATGDKEAKPLKGILREPKVKFPEDPEPVREGVAPLKDALKDDERKGIPPNARWTKIDRKLVNPAALEEAQERFEERSDHVIVLRVLTKKEIEALAAKTQEIRGES